MKTLLAFVFLCSSVLAEAVLVEFEIPGFEPSVHRLFYDTNQPEVAPSGSTFWRLGSPTMHITAPRTGEFNYDERYSGENYNANSVRMWALADKGYTIMDFRADSGGEGPEATTPAFNLLFNEVLTEIPGVDKLREGIVLSKCGGHLLIAGVPRICSDIEKEAAINVNYMSLDPVLDHFLPGDINRDWRIRFDDFLAFSDNYGERPRYLNSPGVSFSSGRIAAAVPEPSSLALIGIGFLVFLRRVLL